MAWGGLREARGDVASLAALGAAVSAARAWSAARSCAVLGPKDLRLHPEGVRIPFTSIGSLVRAVVVTRPSRGVPGTVVVDAAAQAMGIDRVRVLNALWVLDQAGERLLELRDDRVARLDALASALAERCGLPLGQGAGDPLPYPVPEGHAQGVDHLPALLQDLRAAEPGRRAVARELLARAGRFDLLDAP